MHKKNNNIGSIIGVPFVDLLRLLLLHISNIKVDNSLGLIKTESGDKLKSESKQDSKFESNNELVQVDLNKDFEIVSVSSKDHEPKHDAVVDDIK